ncbi:hypothetical protein KUTeg_007672 [Tegillarca granosa]|uniref:Uncharacterized protein n=1 Tax=Tegillarca granosa TaxID=220873 RepID=A0ABQ9FHX4_TEGGR|nr:hypothetical protein KUTeg_007672 [Tegillarca granosa]
MFIYVYTVYCTHKEIVRYTLALIKCSHELYMFISVLLLAVFYNHPVHIIVQTTGDKGRFYAQRRGRRVSKEFEDLTIDTETGKLKKPQNMAKRILSARSSRSSATSSPRHSPSNSKTQSPSLRKKLMESSDGSSSPVSSLEDLHWIGSPEATKSVRRSRKTIEEQELNSELHKLARKNKT